MITNNSKERGNSKPRRESILMDLSKAYDCLPHELSITKLGEYGFDRSSLRLLMDYLNSRKQRTKFGSS